MNFAGLPPTTTLDGTSFVTSVSAANARSDGGRNLGNGSSAAGLWCGGNPGYNAQTEEFTAETTALNLKTITDS